MKYIGYIGTYTKKESKGIYSFELNTESKKIENISLAAELGNPTYLNITDDKKFLYAIASENGKGGLASYSINQETAELTFINHQLVDGPNPCHVNTGKNHRYLFSTNYHKGTVDSYLIHEDGSFSPAVSTIQLTGSGPDPRQEKAHVHFAGMTPDEKYVAVIDLGSDLLITYDMEKNGKLTEVNRMETPAGSGPRHLVFHPNIDTIAYLVTEFSSEVFVLSYDSENGSFSIKEAVKTIPENFNENNQGSAIHISSDGKFVYSGNRGHNSIAVFQVDEQSGNLSFIENTSSEGNWPRDFSLDPSEKFLICSNQESNDLTLFERDTDTGTLTLIEKNISVPEPVCVKFL